MLIYQIRLGDGFWCDLNDSELFFPRRKLLVIQGEGFGVSGVGSQKWLISGRIKFRIVQIMPKTIRKTIC